jgi:hypothetical protein
MILTAKEIDASIPTVAEENDVLNTGFELRYLVKLIYHKNVYFILVKHHH